MYTAIQNNLLASIALGTCDPLPRDWKVGVEVKFTIMSDTNSSSSVAVYDLTKPFCTIRVLKNKTHLEDAQKHWTEIAGRVEQMEAPEVSEKIKDQMKKPEGLPVELDSL
jgi:hypothetical protein